MATRASLEAALAARHTLANNSATATWTKAKTTLAAQGAVLGDAKEGTLAFGAISTSYATIIANSAQGKILAVTNSTDKTIQVSGDGTDAIMTISAGSAGVLDLAANGIYLSGNISIKSLTSAPTSGSVYASLTV